MGRLRWALLGLLAVPLVEILLLIYVAGQIGAPATVLVVVLTALVGLLLVRAEGRHTLRRLQRRLAEGEAPTDELLDGGLLIAAGAFLLTPGLVTDALGFLLAIPPSRVVIRGALKRWVVVPAIDERTGGFATGRVYTFGFPGSGPGGSGDDTVDLGSDAYSVEFDDDGEGNA